MKDNYIRKYHIRYKETTYRPEAVYTDIDFAVRVLKEKRAEQHRDYGDGHYARSLEEKMELTAYVYANEENARKYICLRVDNIWTGAFESIDKLDARVANYKAKYLEVK